MGDTLNSLLQANRSATVLQGIANPAQVNPLAAINSANQAAGSAYDLASKQGQQLWGQALQQSTDENGNVDYPKAQRIAAGMGPAAAMAAGSNLQNLSTLRGQQIAQGAELHSLAGNLSMSLMNDPSDENVAKIRASAVAAGLPQSGLAEIDRIGALPVAQRGAEAYKHAVGNLDALGQLARGGYPTPSLQNIGGQIVAPTVTPPSPYSPGGVNVTPGAINTTASPDTVISLPDVVVKATLADKQAGLATDVGQEIRISGAEARRRQDSGLLPPNAIIRTVPATGGGGGVVDRSGKPVSATNQPRLNTTTPQTTTPPAPPEAPAAAQTSAPAPNYNTGVGAVLNASPAAPIPVPPPPPAVVPPPAPVPASGANGPRDSMMPQPRASLQGGVPVASTNLLLAPSVGPAGAPNPLVPADVNAIMTGMNRAQATRAPGTQQAVGGSGSFAAGPGYDEQTNAATSQERLAADSKLAASYASTVFPYTQALAGYGRGMTTAPGSDFLNAAKGFAGGVLRSVGVNTPLSDDAASYDAQHKWLSQIITSNPVAQGSDARLAATLAGNANTGIHELAGADMMKAGIALMRMTTAARAEWDDPQVRAKYGYYNDFLRDFNKNVDPRAFAWDMYNPEQKKTLVDDLNAHRSDPAYAQKLQDSLAMVRRNGYLGETRAMP